MVDTTLQKLPADDKTPGIINNAVVPQDAAIESLDKATTDVAPATTPALPKTGDDGRVMPVINEAKEANTVESRLNKLTESGSKYMELAKQDTMRNANTRGLINSTMAAGAGTEAAIRNALPIAQQDAQQFNDRDTLNQNTQNEFLKNEQSTQLNERLAEFQSNLKMTEMKLDSDLKLAFETALNDVKFSDEMKLQIVSTMNNIVSDYNDQVTQIGTSDRTAAQQATAIDLIKKNRDAQLAVYEDLLGTFNDWEWGTDFTPDSVTTVAQDNNYWNAPHDAKPLTEPEVGSRIGDYLYQGNGVWEESLRSRAYSSSSN